MDPFTAVGVLVLMIVLAVPFVFSAFLMGSIGFYIGGNGGAILFAILGVIAMGYLYKFIGRCIPDRPFGEYGDALPTMIGMAVIFGIPAFALVIAVAGAIVSQWGVR